MKILITETQLDTLTFQTLINEIINDFHMYCDDELYHDTHDTALFDDIEFCEEIKLIEKVEVVSAYKTESEGNKIIEIGLVFYLEFDFNLGSILWKLEKELRKYLGEGNFKLKYLNKVID